MSMSITLAEQAARILRRALTSEESARMARAESQGFNVVGQHYGNFTKDLPSKFPDTGDNAAFHMDLTPTGGQALARETHKREFESTKNADLGLDNATTEMVVGKLRNPRLMSDEEVNMMQQGQKQAMQSKGTTGAVYPNVMEMSTGNAELEDPLWALLNNTKIEKFAHRHAAANLGNKNPNAAVFNPSAAIFDPADVRLFGAAFDPKNVGKVGYRGSATVPTMAGAGAGALMANSVMNRMSPEEARSRMAAVGMPTPESEALESSEGLSDIPVELITKALRWMNAK